MAQAQFLGNVMVVGNGQDAAGGTYALAGDDHGSVVKRRILEEDVLDKPLVDARIDKIARIYDIVKTYASLYHHEGAHLAARHIHTRQHDGHNGLLVNEFLLVLAAYHEQLSELLEALMGTKRVKKSAYLFLKEHYQADYTHAYQLVHNGTKEPHLEHLAHEEPHHYEHDYAYEDIERTALLHQSVDVIEHQCDKKNVDVILAAALREDGIGFAVMNRMFKSAGYNIREV